jgi:hypothetical protein
VDGLRARADAGDHHAADRLAELLAERGDVDGLRARAATEEALQYRTAAGRLARLLYERGDLDGLRARPTPVTGLPSVGWPSCWPSAATWTGPPRYCAL